MKFITKRNIGILALVVLVFCYTRPKRQGGYTVYGTKWCGYTTKQTDYLTKQYGRGSHTFVDCDKPGNKGKCSGMDGFPVTITMDGTRVEGFNETI